jgi:AAA domain/Toprim-like
MSGVAATRQQTTGWHKRLLCERDRLAFLTTQRGLELKTIKNAQMGWDGTRYTIPVRGEGGDVVNVRRYLPGAPDKVISVRDHGQVRLYAPTDSPADDALVLMVEGELDCLKAAQECDDLWVVTGTGGASSPPSVATLEPLRGREVVIAYDCDDAGRKGACKLADRLATVAATVAILDLGLADREDVTDWLVTHSRTAKDLTRRARQALMGPRNARRPMAVLVDLAVEKAKSDGSRNDAGFWLACQLRDERYAEGEARGAMQRFVSRIANDKRTPYTEAEARDSLRQAFSQPPREPSGLGSDMKAERFRLIGPAELAAPVVPMEWLIRGVWPLGSYGPWGGAKKSLKTYCASIAAIAVASGMPAFGNPEWTVPRARPVIYYGGEGGRELHKRRLQRIARDVYGIDDISAIPLYLVTDIGPFDKPEFWTALERNIDTVNLVHPGTEDGLGLVVMDSLYNYHPANIEVTNLYERGRLLAGLSAPLVDRGIALWVVDHFNKSGSGIDLDRLAQSGMSAWADSWVLFEHGEDPDVVNGTFTISTGIGSRQWGGEEWTLHVDIGPFDKESSTYFTTMKVEAQSGITRGKRRADGEGTTNVELDAGLLEFIEGHTDLTKEQVLSGVMDMWSVGKPRATRRFEALEERGRISCERRSRLEHGRPRTRVLWSVVPTKISIKAKSTSKARLKGSGR